VCHHGGKNVGCGAGCINMTHIVMSPYNTSDRACNQTARERRANKTAYFGCGCAAANAGEPCMVASTGDKISLLAEPLDFDGALADALEQMLLQ
jgi:hypothetical protein